ncbi:MAG: transporter substrate-binding protein [Acidimicrobiia bacterium]|nr:transporter substrate-binding protein [Acidimicrobiia bacterium]
MKRAVGLVAALALGACGGSGGGAEASQHSVTVAFLRAVANVPATEPEFVAELRRDGFEEGRNLTILAHDPAEAHPDANDAKAVVHRWRDQGVNLIVALSTSGARIAAAAAPDVDVLFLSNDPAAAGLVKNVQMPEATLTGATFRVPADRTLSLAQRAVSGLKRIGLAYPPSDPAALANRDAVQQAAQALGITLVTAQFAGPADVAGAINDLAAQGVGALLLSTSPIATRALPETSAAAAAHRLPLISNTEVSQDALLSLSPDTNELGRQLGRQAARLLGGAKPSTVAVEDPKHFVLILNLKAAAALGITLSDDLIREADKVIQ